METGLGRSLVGRAPAARRVGFAVIAASSWLTVGPTGAQDVAQPASPSAAPSGGLPTSSPATPSAVTGGTPSGLPGPVAAAPKVAPPAAVNIEAVPPPPSPEAELEPSKPKALALEPPLPARAPAAVLRVLDKVTAETMAFEAPVGKRVRYKSLVFEVKACVTRAATDPEPQPSVYLLITSDAGVASGAAFAPRQVFKGWMFANAPGVHALQHPVYDAWLVACNAAAPSI